MTEAIAFIRSGWLTATSYRINAMLSMASFAVAVVPIYFIAGALEPVLADSIRSESGSYFGFVVIGMIALRFVMVAMMAVPNIVGRTIGNGALEAYLATPIRLPVLLAGLVSYDVLWTLARALLFLFAGILLGMRISGYSLLPGLLILVVLVAAHVPIGLVSAACVLTFRNVMSLASLVLSGSALLGGVYYPAHIVPSWLQYVSGVLPMTYGLRAFRETLLNGAAFQQVMQDFLILSLFAAVLWPIGIAAFRLALRYAQQTGTLAHY